MRKIMFGIAGLLLMVLSIGVVSANSNGQNNRCHDTDRGIDPYVFGSIKAGSLVFEDKCFISDSGVALAIEGTCAPFDGWCYTHGVSRTVRYPSFEYLGHTIDVSEVGEDYAVFHVIRNGRDKEYRMSIGDIIHTPQGIIIRLDRTEPERNGVAYSVANEYIKMESILCPGGCNAGACIGNSTPMDVVRTSCSAPKPVDPIPTVDPVDIPTTDVPDPVDPTPVNNSVVDPVVVNPTPVNNSNTPNKKCKDSDGIDYYTKGKVRGYDMPTGKYVTVEDECEYDTINEYVCDGIYGKETEFKCPNGCSNGACIADENASDIVNSNATNNTPAVIPVVPPTIKPPKKDVKRNRNISDKRIVMDKKIVLKRTRTFSDARDNIKQMQFMYRQMFLRMLRDRMRGR